jgi:type IV fimbrial biogenesis protein FimT
MRLKTPKRAHRSHAGFTIIELMFAVAIAAILVAVAIPSFRTMIVSNRLTTQANELVGAVNYARSEAISHNNAVTFCRSNLEASTNCSGSSGAWRFWVVRNAAGTVLRSGTINLYGGNLSLSSTLANDTMVFSADGLVRSGGALITDRTFTVCAANISDDNIRTVTVGAGSRFSTVKSSGGC